MSKNEVTRQQLIDLGFEWFKLQLKSGKDVFPHLFKEVSINDYLTLHLLSEHLLVNESKVYLKEIAEQMDLPMKKVSPMVQLMQDRGLVTWKHDRQGTYITISEDGKTAMEKQQNYLTDFIEKCASRYGYEKLLTLIKYRNEFNEIMEKVIETM